MTARAEERRAGSPDEGAVTTSDSDTAVSEVAGSFQNLDAAMEHAPKTSSINSQEQPELETPATNNMMGTNEHEKAAAPPPAAAAAPEQQPPPAPGGPPAASHDDNAAQVQEQEAPPEDQRTRLQTFVIVAALCTAVFLAALDVTIVTVAIPTISADFRSNAGYTWVGSAFLLANAAAAPSWGKMSDIFGRKPVLLTAVGVFWVGSLLCGASANMAMLIVGRAVQGAGGGGTLILVNICISDMFSVRKRGVYLGFVGLTWAVAGGFGPVLGGVFTTKATWRWCFYVNLPVSGVAFFVLWYTVNLHNPRTPLRQGLAAIDWLGTLAIVAGTLMFLLGLELGGAANDWGSAACVCLLVLGLAVVAAFFVVELKVATFPVVPVRLFRTPRNLAILGLNACHGFVFISASYYLPLYFQGVLGADALMSGVYILPFTFVLGVTSAVAGFYTKKTGRYVPLIIGGFALMTLGYGLFIDLGPTANWAKIVCFQVVLGTGVGPNFQSPLLALQSTVQPRDIASATGTFMFFRQLSTSISIVVGGVIFASGMARQEGRLRAALGGDEAVVRLLTGSNAQASVTQVQQLPAAQRAVAQAAYWRAMRDMFIFYVAFAGLGLVVSFFVSGSTLTEKGHTEHKTGLGTLHSDKKQQQHAVAQQDEEKAPRAGLGGGAGGGGGVVEGGGRPEAEVAANHIDEANGKQ